MSNVSRQEVSRSIVELMPHIIQGVQLGFLAKRTITQTQFLVIIAIFSRQQCSMRVLAESMHVSMPTMSGIVERLVAAGYVLRESDPADRRLVMVQLTTKGRQVVQQFKEAAGSRWAEALRSLKPEELGTFKYLIDKLNKGLGKRP